MRDFEPGMLAKSTAGHDSGQLFVIVRVEDEYVYLADGRLKKIEYPKKKNKKHIQVIYWKPQQIVRNEDIKIAIREYKQHVQNSQDI